MSLGLLGVAAGVIALAAGSVSGYLVPPPPLRQDDPKRVKAIAPRGDCEFPTPPPNPRTHIVSLPHPVPPVSVFVYSDGMQGDAGADLNRGEIKPRPLPNRRFAWQSDSGALLMALCTLHIDGHLSNCTAPFGTRWLKHDVLQDLESWRFTPSAECTRNKNGHVTISSPKTVWVTLMVRIRQPDGG